MAVQQTQVLPSPFLGDKLTSTYKKSRKREKKSREDLKATIPSREHGTFGGYKATKESKRLNKEIRKERKFQKWNDKYEASLEKLGDKPITKHGTGSIEKRKLLKLGVYRDKKGGQVLDYPSSNGKAYSNKYKKKLKYK